MPHLGGEVKTFAKETVTLSTARATLVTPATGKRVRVISVNSTSVHTTPTSFEIYFGTGGYWGTTATKAIYFTHLYTGSAADKPSNPTGSMVWPDLAGPIGAIDEVVSMRTGADIASYGTFVIVYREE